MKKYFINRNEVINNANSSLWVYVGDMNDLIVPEAFKEVEITVNLNVDGKDNGFVHVGKQYQWDIDEGLLNPENLWNETDDGSKWYLVNNYNILTPEKLPLEFLEKELGLDFDILVNDGCIHTKKIHGGVTDKYAAVYDATLVAKIEEPLINEMVTNEVLVTDEDLYWSHAVVEVDTSKIIDIAKAMINNW